jgi:hypothetical protein
MNDLQCVSSAPSITYTTTNITTAQGNNINIEIGKTYEIQHWYSSIAKIVKVTKIEDDEIHMVTMTGAERIRMTNYKAGHFTWEEVAA